MKKTLDLIRENLSLVDCAVVLLDARVPISSKNPLISSLLKDKPTVLCFNKADLADDRASSAWKKYYASKDVSVAFTDAREGANLKRFLELLRGEVERSFEGKKRTNRRGRIMIVGIPNVGKSTLINRLVGKKVCATGNKPGVTRGKQWLRISNELELLDTPGVLWHKFDDPLTALHLAITGAIKDEILQIDELALKLIEFLAERYPDALAKRYGIEVTGTPLELMEKVAEKRGFLLSGANVDYDRCANTILDEFRKGLIARVTLELPDETTETGSAVSQGAE